MKEMKGALSEFKDFLNPTSSVVNNSNDHITSVIWCFYQLKPGNCFKVPNAILKFLKTHTLP